MLNLLATGPLRSGDIVTMLGRDPTLISRYLTKMVKEGLVEGYTSPEDKRGRVYRLVA
jgi:DNA-binding MarR family transcriptional regulator